MHLESLDLLAVRPGDQRALQADIGGLDPGAGVRAAVHVDRDRGVEAGQPALQLADQVGGPGLGLDDGELAELDAGAGHRVPAERTRAGRQAGGIQFGHQILGALGRHVEDDHLLLGGGVDPAAPVPGRQVSDHVECVGRQAAHDRREADVVVPVALRVHAHVIADPVARRVRGRAVRQGVAEVLLLEYLAELLRAPVRDQELDPRPVPQAPVAVVPEQASHARPDLGYLARPDERAEPLADHRIGGQATADPQVVAGFPVRFDDADEGDVVDLVDSALCRAAADRGLELARQDGERGVADVRLADGGDLRRAVDDLVRVDAGLRAVADRPRGIAAGLGGGQAYRLERLPDVGDVLDLDPVQLDVLPVGDVRCAAGVTARDVGDDPQLVVGQPATVDTDAQHEVTVVELLRLQHRGLAAVEARPALCVQPVPAKPAAQVSRVDGVEAVLGVDVDDPLTDVEPVVVALVFLVLVERLAIAERPLAFAAFTLGSSCDWHVGGSSRFGDARDTRTWAPPGRISDMVQLRVRRGAPGIARAPGTRNPGRRLTGEQTDSAADAQEIDVTAPDEQRVRNTHESRITCNEPDCPGSVRHVDGAKGFSRRHTRGNMASRDGYSRGTCWLAWRSQPWRTQLSGGSAPVCVPGWPAGGRCWQSHQVRPGHSSWCRFRHGTQIISPLCDGFLALGPLTGVNPGHAPG